MLTTIDGIINRCLATLIGVNANLIRGVDENDLIRRYNGKFIAPGVSIRKHLAELEKYGCLRHEGGKVFLKDECNPANILEISK